MQETWKFRGLPQEVAASRDKIIVEFLWLSRHELFSLHPPTSGVHSVMFCSSLRSSECVRCHCSSLNDTWLLSPCSFLVYYINILSGSGYPPFTLLFCQAQQQTAAFLEMSYANRMLQHVDGNNSETVACSNKDEGKGQARKNRLKALRSARVKRECESKSWLSPGPPLKMVIYCKSISARTGYTSPRWHSLITG